MSRDTGTKTLEDNMPRAKRICAKTDCPNPADGRYCTGHNKAHEARRGTAHQRGYDSAHQAMREAFKEEVTAGLTMCWRCKQLITPGQAWDLGHDDNDRTLYRGPEHANQCNRAAAGRKAHAQ